MTQWTRIAATDECPEGQGIEVVTAGRVIGLYQVEGEYYAIDGVCPHQGGPLGKGALTGCVVTCPWHGWQFDVRNGQHAINGNLCQPQFTLRIDGNQILVAVDDDDKEIHVD